MKVIEITQITQKEHSKYLQFIENHKLGSIHQTPEWGEFQTRLAGRDRYWCFAVEDEKGHIRASALVIRQQLPLKKSWLYCPRGPVGDYKNTHALHLLLDHIRQLAKKQNAVYFRFDPPLLESEKIDWEELRAVKAHAHYQPENTLILDLSLPEEELLKQMKPKGRYNIKVAQKHGVKIRVSDNSSKDIDAFYNLLEQTTARDEFSGHNKKYYHDMLTILGHKNGSDSTLAAKLYLAEYDEKIIAGIIVTRFKDTATYYFGASGNEYRNLMAPYFLQWQAIQDAKEAGLKYYDFLGITPATDHSRIVQQKDSKIVSASRTKHPWAGVTDFKLKFGGRRVDYQSAREIIYQPFWYFVMKLVKQIAVLLP